MMTTKEIEIELQRSLEGTHQYRNGSQRRAATGANATRTSAFGATTTRTSAFGAGVTGAGVTGAGVTGANATGAGVTGASATGASATGAGATAAARLEPSGRVLYPELSYAIVGALIEVHRWLGPGQLESTYQNALEKELGLRDIPFRAQVPIAAQYKDWEVGEFFADVIVEEAIVLELKAVSTVLPVHRAQLISYLHATGCRLGLLVNFHVPVMIQGIKRIAL